jgi:hypothetical protein
MLRVVSEAEKVESHLEICVLEAHGFTRTDDGRACIDPEHPARR